MAAMPGVPGPFISLLVLKTKATAFSAALTRRNANVIGIMIATKTSL
jgi:hypothetical protein